MSKYSIEDSTLISLADALRNKTKSTDKLTIDSMVSTIGDMKYTPDVIADVPENEGVLACLSRAAQMREIQYTPIDELPCNNNSTIIPAGATVNGLMYSSVRKTDNFIPFNISLHTFMTALQNPKSVLYTERAQESNIVNAGCYYGTNCSEYVSYSHGFDYFATTQTLPLLPWLVDEYGVHNDAGYGVCWDAENEVVDTDKLQTELKLCDILNSSNLFAKSGVKTVGHAMLVTGIWRDSNGKVINLEISESTFPRIKATIYTYEKFVTDFIEGTGYRVYRNANLANVTYYPSKFIPVAGAGKENIIYGDICTNRGDCVSINKKDTIIINPLVTTGYTGINIYKDGTLFGTYELADIELSNLAAGKYLAVLTVDGVDLPTEKTSTRFEVVNCNVTRDGTRYIFNTNNGIPRRIIFKQYDYKTFYSYLVTDEDIANGYADIDYVSNSLKNGFVSVPFETEYGFVTVTKAYNDMEPEVTEYTVTFENTNNFTISNSSHTLSNNVCVVPVGETFSATITPADGYVLKSIMVNDKSISFNEDGTFSFLPVADSTIIATIINNQSDKYQFVEYIETDGNQYIDTGVIASNYSEGITYEFKGRYLGHSDKTQDYLFGCLNNSSRTGNFSYSKGETTEFMTLFVGGNSNEIKKSNHVGNNVDFTLNITASSAFSSKNDITALINNTAMGETVATFATKAMPTANIYFFACNLNGNTSSSTSKPAIARAYYFRMLDANGIEIRNFIPCYRKEDGVIGLYDTVTEQFFTNAGTGTFIKGADV